MNAAHSSSLETSQVSACIHCGLCLSACPTYLETGDENNSPRGRLYLMRALQEERLSLERTTVRHLDLCLGCRACEAVCPSGVPYGSLLEHTRLFVEQNHRRSLWQWFLRHVFIKRILPHPARLRLALKSAFQLKRRFAWMVSDRVRAAIDLLPEGQTPATIPDYAPASAEPVRATVGFLRGCVMQELFSQTNRATIGLLNRAGYDVVTPARQTCCGALHAHNGDPDLARQCARTNIAAFETAKVEAVLVNAAGCGAALKEYGHLLRDDAVWRERAAAFSRKIRDLTEWLQPPDLVTRDSGRAVSCGRVTYHDACHLAHAQRITEAPRALIRALAGKQFVELPESDVCCGSAGSYNLTEPAMARRLQQRKVDHILSTGAELVVTANPGCLLQIQAGLRAAGAAHVHACHISDYLARFSPVAASPRTAPCPTSGG